MWANIAVPNTYRGTGVASLFFGHVINIVTVLDLLLAQDRCIIGDLAWRINRLNADMKCCEARHDNLVPRHANDTSRVG